MKYLFNFIGYRIIILLHFFAASLSVLDLFGIAVIFPYLQLVSNPEIIHSNIYLNKIFIMFFFRSEVQFCYSLGALLLILFFLKMAISLLLNKYQAYYLAGIGHKLISNIFELLMHARYDFFISRSPSELLGMNYSYSSQVVVCLQMWLGMVNEIIFFAILLGFSFYFNPLITMGFLLFIALTAAAIYLIIIIRMTRYGKEQSKIDVEIHRWTHATVSSIKDIKIMGLEEMFSKRTKELSNKTRNIGWRMSVAVSSPRILIEYISISGLIICALIFVLPGINMKEMLPTLGLIGVAALRILPAFGRITNFYGGFKYSKNYLEKLQEFHLSLISNMQKISEKQLQYLAILKLERINFYYGEKHILKDLSMDIPKGHSVGIVGASGSGKSTLLDLITGLHKNYSGQFYLDDQIVDPYTTDIIRKYVGYVPQQISLIDETIAFNIAFSHNYDEAKIREVLKASNLLNFVETLPLGMKTSVGEAGVRLSGGQKQRIGIARALYRNPEILIFDESTSSLDVITEKEITEEIIKLSGIKTLLIVTHRLSTVKNCDIIYVMKEGSILARGSHMELIKSCELYKKMNEPELK